MGQFRLLVEFEVKPGRLDEFKAAAEKLIAVTKAEPGTSGYDGYISADGTEVRIIENFVDPAAYLAHSARITPVVPELMAAASMVHKTILGEVDEEARAALMGPASDFYSHLGGIER